MLTEFHSKLLKNSDIAPKEFIELIKKFTFTIYEIMDDKFIETTFVKLSEKFNDDAYYLTDLFCTSLENLPTI